MQTEGIDILSIDAKDIYISNNYKKYIGKNSVGYNIKLKDGSINTKKFINVLDYSLDLIELRKVYEKVYRNTKFTFQQNNHTYSTKVINITFKYSVKLFNKIKKDTYVKFGYDINDIKFNDSVCVINNELVAIQTNTLVESSILNELLTKNFYFENGQYHAKSNIETLYTVAQLRDILYEKGFYCDGVKYIRFKRSSGSSRVGKCLFIDEKLYSRMHKWELCGLKIKEGQDIDLAGFESCISLSLSSIIDTIEISPQNILIINDYDSVFEDEVVETKLNGNSLVSKRTTTTLKNCIWDGQSLLDESLFGKYKKYGMLLLRNRLFKSCCFKTYIQKWFADNNITNVSQLNGFTLAKEIKDIKLITTPSSIKYIKFGSLNQWLENIDTIFGIVKHDKPTHYFNGKMVQTHYQLLNTLQLDEEKMKEFLKPSLDYLYKLKTDPTVLRYHIKYPINKEILSKPTPTISKNDIIFKLLGLNESFTKTKLYYDFKNDVIKSFVKSLKKGHVLVNGNYSTLLGNPIEMLLQTIGKFSGESQIGIGNIYSINFDFDKKILISRSPHVTMGNVMVANNVYNEWIDRYLGLSKEIVCVNSINESTLDRLSGCDFDSDSALLTDNNILITTALLNYDKFKVPVNHVESIKRKRKYTSCEKADLDVKSSTNKIGDIINLSQDLNSLLWHHINNGLSYNDVEELYFDICQLDVLSGIEIDKAKKEFVVDTYSEMKRIRSRWTITDNKNRKIKPKFFAHIIRSNADTKKFYNPNKKCYLHHATSMDYLQKVVNSFQSSREHIGKEKLSFLKFSDLLNVDNFNKTLVKYDQVERIINIITDMNTSVSKLFLEDSYSDTERYKIYSELKQECVEYIGTIKLGYSTMYYLLTLCEREEYRKIGRSILYTLFGYPNTEFFKILQVSKDNICYLTECKDECDIMLYDIKFKKIYKNSQFR